MLHELLTDADRIVVVDVETTGLYNTDRVVEVAAVTVDERGCIVDEWETLVDPQRDVGPTHIHGVTASMVSAAPTFDEVAAALANRLYGAVLVAHNLTFDARVIGNEFNRLGARFVPGDGVCTLRLGGGKLADVCRANGVELTHAHRALGDARATAEVLGRVVNGNLAACSGAHVFDVTASYNARTLRREMVTPEEVPMPYLARLASQVHHYGEHGGILAYMDLLDRALADLVITDQEAAELAGFAGLLGLTRDDVTGAHRRYIDELVAAAVRDGVVTDDEFDLLHRAAAALGMDPEVVDDDTSAWRPHGDSGVELAAGMRVCFTGTATYPDGSELPRAKLHQIAANLGLEPTNSVTKKHCDLLVAADPSSQSGKAAKARKYGIPNVDVHDLLLAQAGSTVPAR
jgi:DNA polymerase-3 subunit epsilon